MPKVPVIQESVFRPSIVKVTLVKSENKGITNKESEKMEGKIPRFVPKGEQKEEKKSKSEEVIYKKVKSKTLGLAIIMPQPQSQPPKALTSNQILYHQWNQGGQQELISLTQGTWALW